MFYCVYERNLNQYYKSSLCSVASLCNLLLLSFAIVLPFILSYNSQGLWMKSIECTEQPNVTFKKEFFLQMRTSNRLRYWATDDLFTKKTKHLFSPLLIKFKEDDYNFDNLQDHFTSTIRVPLPDNEKIYSLQLLLIFNYELKCMRRIVLEGAVLIQSQSMTSLSNLQVFGDMTLHQRELFASTEDSNEFNYPILPSNTRRVRDWKLSNILYQYWRRKVTTKLTNTYTLRETEEEADHLEINVGISFPKEIVLYHPSFWHIIKWGWIQYVSIFVVVFFFINKIRNWIFVQKIVRTYVFDDLKKRS